MDTALGSETATGLCWILLILGCELLGSETTPGREMKEKYVSLDLKAVQLKHSLLCCVNNRLSLLSGSYQLSVCLFPQISS